MFANNKHNMLYTELDLHPKDTGATAPTWEDTAGTASSFDPRVLFDNCAHAYTDVHRRERLVTCTLLCSMVAPTASASHWTVQYTDWMGNGSLRHEGWHLAATGQPVPTWMRRALLGDVSYRNVCAYIDSIDRDKFKILASEVAMLGTLGKSSYGVKPDLILQDKTTGSCGGVEWKSGSRPAGIAAYNKWVGSACTGAPPDSKFTRDSFQVHLTRHALSAVLDTRSGKSYDVSGFWKLVYGQHSADAAHEEIAHPIPEDVLARVLSIPLGYIQAVRTILDGNDMPRVLLNAAWSFPQERRKFARSPYVAHFDTEHGTNRRRFHAANFTGVDGDN